MVKATFFYPFFLVNDTTNFYIFNDKKNNFKRMRNQFFEKKKNYRLSKN